VLVITFNINSAASHYRLLQSLCLQYFWVDLGVSPSAHLLGIKIYQSNFVLCLQNDTLVGHSRLEKLLVCMYVWLVLTLLVGSLNCIYLNLRSNLCYRGGFVVLIVTMLIRSLCGFCIVLL